jgi:hypothetical protein
MTLAELVGEDPSKKKKNWIASDMKSLYKNVMAVDDKPAFQIVKNAADKSGVKASLLMASAFQEGMNKAIAKPDEVSDAYGRLTPEQQNEYPVDGFYNYGLDRFGERAADLAKYLPKDFKYLPVDAVNEKGSKIKTAAFKNNEDALIAKAAMMRAEMDNVRNYAGKLGVKLDDEAMDYFTVAAYNGGMGNAKMMLDEYAKAGDKPGFIGRGDTSRKGVHKNIEPRMENMRIADELLGPMAGPKMTPFNTQDGLSKALTSGK